MIAHLSFLVALELFGFGLVVGTVSSAFGVGGGLLVVPIFMLAYGLPSDVATASSLGVILFSSLAGTLAYLREKRIDFRVAAIFMAFSIPGSIGGALLSNWLRERHTRVDLLQIAFAATMIVIAATRLFGLLRSGPSHGGVAAEAGTRGAAVLPSPPQSPGGSRPGAPGAATPLAPPTEAAPVALPAAAGSFGALARRLVDRHGRTFEYTAHLFPGALIAFGGGLLGALLGLGGGIVYVPVLTLFLGVPAAIATATSTFTILAVTPVAAAIRWSTINWGYVLLLSTGVVISAGTMPRLIHRVNDRWVLTGFWIVAIVAAVRLLMADAGIGL